MLKEVMEKTFSRRRQWILEKAPLASEVLQKYPCLSSTKMVICQVYNGNLPSVWFNWFCYLICIAASRFPYGGQTGGASHIPSWFMAWMGDKDSQIQQGWISYKTSYEEDTGRAGGRSFWHYISCRYICMENRSSECIVPSHIHVALLLICFLAVCLPSPQSLCSCPDSLWRIGLSRCNLILCWWVELVYISCGLRLGSTAADLLMSLVYHCLQPYLDIWFSLCWLMGQWCMVLSCIHQPPCCAEYVSCGSFHCIAVSTTCFTCHLYIYYIYTCTCLSPSEVKS